LYPKGSNWVRGAILPGAIGGGGREVDEGGRAVVGPITAERSEFGTGVAEFCLGRVDGGTGKRTLAVLATAGEGSKKEPFGIICCTG